MVQVLQQRVHVARGTLVLEPHVACLLARVEVVPHVPLDHHLDLHAVHTDVQHCARSAGSMAPKPGLSNLTPTSPPHSHSLPTPSTLLSPSLPPPLPPPLPPSTHTHVYDQLPRVRNPAVARIVQVNVGH